MKMTKVILTLALSLAAFNSQADSKNPSAADKAKLIKLASSDVVVKAILERTAKEVLMASAQCKSEIKSVLGQADDFNGNKTISGALELNQMCHNADADAATNSSISITISSDRVLIDSVQVERSGF